MHDAEGEPAELEHRVFGDEGIGHDDAGQRVDPRRQRRPAFSQAGGRRIGREVVGDPRVGPDLDPTLLERLQAVDMIGVVVTVADDDPPVTGCSVVSAMSWPSAGRGRHSERIEHHRAIGGGDEAGVSVEALVCVRHHVGLAEHVVAVRRHPRHLHRHADRLEFAPCGNRHRDARHA